MSTDVTKCSTCGHWKGSEEFNNDYAQPTCDDCAKIEEGTK